MTKAIFVQQKASGSLLGLTALLFLHLAVIVLSINLVAAAYPLHIEALTKPQLLAAIESTAAIACVAPLFYFARFSFGYVVGFWMYGMVAGFLVISHSTRLPYDQHAARISAAFALVTFLLPVLFLRPNMKFGPALRELWLDRLLTGLLIFVAGLLVWSSAYGFHFLAYLDSIKVRSETIRPPLLNYLNGICIGAILPFVFACFAIRKRFVMAAISCALALAFYPALLNKTVFFLTPWMIFIFILYRYIHPKAATVLSVTLPMIAGMAVYLAALPIAPLAGLYALGFINLRLFAIPSSALDYYYSFFSGHPLTEFCQISLLKPLMQCPYSEQLGVVFANEYHFGNFNASLFATEGIASLGLFWAPLGTFVCGLILSLGNCVSSRLTPVMVAVSSCVIVQVLLNVPLSTVLLSNGCVVLFLLWGVTPKELVDERSTAVTEATA